MLDAFKKTGGSRQQSDELQSLIAASREERAALSTMLTQVQLHSAKLASATTGLGAASASAALSACVAGGASACGSLAATGFGTTLFVASSGCEKLAGMISPGVTTTLAPILVQFHIFMAKAMGMRMQPCEAG